MQTIYSYTSPFDKHVIKNADDSCLNCTLLCDKRNELVLCPVFKEKRRRGIIIESDATLYVCTNYIIKSSRLFREKQRVYWEIMNELDSLRQNEQRRLTFTINRLIHNLISLNAQSIQAIYSKISQDKFIQENRNDLLNEIEKHVKKDSFGTAKLIIDLLKNEKLEKTEFSSYGKLFENEPVSIRPYSIHKIILLILNSFWDEFNEKDVRVVIGSCYNKVMVDYDVVAAILVYLFDNNSKYILPDTTLNIQFETLSDYVQVEFDMVSIKIEQDEETRIFEEGYSGINPKKINRDGNGLGLSLAKRLVNLINGRLTIIRDCDESKRQSRLGIEFENNKIVLSLPFLKDKQT